jgi:hypothetical protein
MHFGARVRNYLKQMYKECADEIAAAGLPVVLQFGETQWWYFPNASGMPYYDDETRAAFEAVYARPMHRFLANTDSPDGDRDRLAGGFSAESQGAVAAERDSSTNPRSRLRQRAARCL